jgi:adenosine deaminase
LVEFLAKFQWMIAVLADYDACRRVAYENVDQTLRNAWEMAFLGEDEKHSLISG